MTRLATIAGVLGFLGVALGAMGAHAFQETLVANGRVDTYETAAHYHLAHAIALFALALGASRLDPKWGARAAWCWTFGIIIFSGSLYILALANVRWMGAIAPIGGSLLMLGWLLMIPACKPLTPSP